MIISAYYEYSLLKPVEHIIAAEYFVDDDVENDFYTIILHFGKMTRLK